MEHVFDDSQQTNIPSCNSTAYAPLSLTYWIPWWHHGWWPDSWCRWQWTEFRSVPEVGSPRATGNESGEV